MRILIMCNTIIFIGYGSPAAEVGPTPHCVHVDTNLCEGQQGEAPCIRLIGRYDLGDIQKRGGRYPISL